MVTLSSQDQSVVTEHLADFANNWDEKRLAAAIRTLPPADNPLRCAILVGICRIDLKRRWQQGQKVTVESYLKACPELGSPETVAVGLVEAELQAREKAGVGQPWEDLCKRFPTQVAEMKEAAAQTKAMQDSQAFDQTEVAASMATPAEIRKVPAVPERFGRYRIVKTLGSGGMARVYLAHDTQLDRQVALKIPHFAAESGPEVLERFYREGRAAATLSHPNLCPVYDLGEVSGVPYLAMAYVEGKPLSASIRAGLGQQAVARLVRKLALAMAEAHEHGVVHRDLKPSNVMLNQRGEPIIMDFGLARRAGQESVRLTQEGAILGTPSYMAPERIEGNLDDMGPAADVYSLGVILYELLTGRLPFQGSMLSVVAQIVNNEPQPPSAYRQDVDPRLETICLRAMAKDPGARFKSMRAFAGALFDYLQSPVVSKSGITADSVSMAREGTDETDIRTVVDPRMTKRSTEAREGENESAPVRVLLKKWKEQSGQRRDGLRSWLLFGSLAAGGLVLVAGLIIWLMRDRKPDEPPDREASARQAEQSTKDGTSKQAPPKGPFADWKTVAPRGSNFSVSMPGTPKESKVMQPTKDGEVEMWQYQLNAGNILYAACYFDIAGRLLQPKQIDEVFDGSRDGIVKNVNGKLHEYKKITLDDRPGRELVVLAPKELQTRCRFYLDKQRFFMVFVVVQGQSVDLPEVEHYLKSFKFTP
jgi:serine/threonine protein kinase